MFLVLIFLCLRTILREPDRKKKQIEKKEEKEF